MSDETLAFVAGTMFILFMGITSCYIAFAVAWDPIGRMALAVIGGAQFLYVLNRILYETDAIGPSTAFAIGGLIGATTLAIQLNLLVVHRMETKHYESLKLIGGTL